MPTEHPTPPPAWLDPSEPMELLHAPAVREAFAPRVHETFTIGVVERGAVRVRHRGAWTVHRPGGVLVIEPGEVHAGEPFGCESWGWRLLHPSAALLRRVAGRPTHGPADARSHAPLFDRGCLADADLAARVAAVHAALAPATPPYAAPPYAAPPTPDAARALADVLATLVRRHAAPARDATASPAAHVVVRRVIAFLHERLAQPVRIAELAEVGGVGPFALIRLFRREVGVPPYAYLDLLRVERARRLLCAGTSIPAAAYATGFSDQSHLTRHFRRVLGVPPGRYLRGHAAARTSAAA